MDTEAYVLIKLARADEEKVLKRILALENVVSANVVFGEWDMIAKVKAANPQALATFVIDEIRGLASVQLTSSLIVAK